MRATTLAVAGLTLSAAIGHTSPPGPSSESEATCTALRPKHDLELSWSEPAERALGRCPVGGVPDGPYIKWYQEGPVEARGTYRDGEFHGKWTRWYSNGKKRDEGRWVDGKPDGVWIRWHENGQKKAEGAYRDGEEDGRWQ